MSEPKFRIKATAPQELRDLFAIDDALIIVGGAMTTQALYDDFELNPCHLFGDGTIRRFHQVIAHRHDIEIEGEDFGDGVSDSEPTP